MQVKWFLTLGLFYKIVYCQSNENDTENTEDIEIPDQINESPVISNEEAIESKEEQNNENAFDNIENREAPAGAGEYEPPLMSNEFDREDSGAPDYFPAISKENTFNSMEENEQYAAEKKAGDPSGLFASNPHLSYPDVYKDLSRRFVLQYPYKDSNLHHNGNEEAEANLDKIIKDFLNAQLTNSRLKPVKAPPELVLAISRLSALREAAKSVSSEDLEKDILRSGNYWNNVWREDVDPDILRTQNDDVIQSLRMKFEPGSKLYEIVSKLKKTSPRLIYVINK